MRHPLHSPPPGQVPPGTGILRWRTLPERLAARLDRYLTGRVRVISPAGIPLRSPLALGDHPLGQGLVVLLCRLLLGAFFRRIEVEGLEHVPPTGGGLVVAWHPNGLMDPALMVASLPRPVVFGAREGLFRWPGLGALLRAAGAVPIHRSMDRSRLTEAERREANRRSLDALAAQVVQGDLSCLFPEGDSHDSPHLLTLKTGVARLYYQARMTAGVTPFILPVGLHYDAKMRFRSHVLVRFHPPLALPPDLDVSPQPQEAEEVGRQRCQQLTASIEGALAQVVRATESWDLHHRLAGASRILRSERASRAGVDLDPASMLESQVGFARVWAAVERWRGRDPERIHRLLHEVGEYMADLRALDLEDEDLDHGPLQGRPGQLLLLLAGTVGVFAVAPSLIVLGGVVNLGPFLLLKVGSHLAARRQKDVATLKLLGGVILYPLAWVGAALLAARLAWELHAARPMLVPQTPLLAALAVLVLSVVGGALALRYLRLVREMARVLRVRLTRLQRRRSIERLRGLRRRLARELEALEDGLDLPGAVTAEGTVLSTEEVPPGGRA